MKILVCYDDSPYKGLHKTIRITVPKSWNTQPTKNILKQFVMTYNALHSSKLHVKDLYLAHVRTESKRKKTEALEYFPIPLHGTIGTTIVDKSKIYVRRYYCPSQFPEMEGMTITTTSSTMKQEKHDLVKPEMDTSNERKHKKTINDDDSTVKATGVGADYKIKISITSNYDERNDKGYGPSESDGYNHDDYNRTENVDNERVTDIIITNDIEKKTTAQSAKTILSNSVCLERNNTWTCETPPSEILETQLSELLPTFLEPIPMEQENTVTIIDVPAKQLDPEGTIERSTSATNFSAETPFGEDTTTSTNSSQNRKGKTNIEGNVDNRNDVTESSNACEEENVAVNDIIVTNSGDGGFGIFSENKTKETLILGPIAAPELELPHHQQIPINNGADIDTSTSNANKQNMDSDGDMLESKVGEKEVSTTFIGNHNQETGTNLLLAPPLTASPGSEVPELANTLYPEHIHNEATSLYPIQKEQLINIVENVENDDNGDNMDAADTRELYTSITAIDKNTGSGGFGIFVKDNNMISLSVPLDIEDANIQPEKQQGMDSTEIPPLDRDSNGNVLTIINLVDDDVSILESKVQEGKESPTVINIDENGWDTNNLPPPPPPPPLSPPRTNRNTRPTGTSSSSSRPIPILLPVATKSVGEDVYNIISDDNTIEVEYLEAARTCTDSYSSTNGSANKSVNDTVCTNVAVMDSSTNTNRSNRTAVGIEVVIVQEQPPLEINECVDTSTASSSDVTPTGFGAADGAGAEDGINGCATTEQKVTDECLIGDKSISPLNLAEQESPNPESNDDIGNDRHKHERKKRLFQGWFKMFSCSHGANCDTSVHSVDSVVDTVADTFADRVADSIDGVVADHASKTFSPTVATLSGTSNPNMSENQELPVALFHSTMEEQGVEAIDHPNEHDSVTMSANSASFAKDIKMPNIETASFSTEVADFASIHTP